MSELLDRLSAALAGRYAVEGEADAGGMAIVYRVHDVRHHRTVALKVVRPELAGALGIDRFLREIELAASLQHPHILPVFDSGALDEGSAAACRGSSCHSWKGNRCASGLSARGGSGPGP